MSDPHASGSAAGPTSAVPSSASPASAPATSPAAATHLSSASPRLILVGSTNGTKVGAVRSVVDRLFASLHADSWLIACGRESLPAAATRPNEVRGVPVDSAVRAQPLSGEETQAGAVARAKAALAVDAACEYGVGIEGGMERVGEKWFECGWVAVVDRTGRIGVGTSARFELAPAIASELQTGRVELCEIADRLSGESGVRSRQGMMGVLTNNLLPRQECYEHGVVFAFAPFISAAAFWQEAPAPPPAPVEPLLGGCLCRVIRYRILPSADRAPTVVYCHCTLCRRASGAPVVPWASVRQSQLQVDSGSPSTYASSSAATRQFCSTCGTPLFFRSQKNPGEVDVAVATLDQPETLPPTRHIYTDSRIPWFETQDGCPRHADDAPWNELKAQQQ